MHGLKLDTVQTSLKAETITTCDGLSKLLVRLTQDADEMNHSTSIYECHLIVSVFIDEVPRGACGITLHCLVVTGEKLDQSWNTL